MIILELTKKITLLGREHYRAYRGKCGNNTVSFRIYNKMNDTFHVVVEVFNGDACCGENVIYSSIQQDVDQAKALLVEFLGEEIDFLD